MFKKNTQPLSGSGADSSEEIELLRLFGALLDHRWLITGIVLLFTVFGILYALLATPIYRADALVQIEDNSANSLVSDLSSILPYAKPKSAAEIELIKSRMVIGRTVDDLELDTIVEVKHFPVIGSKLAKLLKQSQPSISVTRLNVSPNDINRYFGLRIIDNKSYEIIINGKEPLTGVVGKLLTLGEFSILVNEISAKKGDEFLVKKQSMLQAINKVQESLSIVEKGKDAGVFTLSIEGKDKKLIERILNRITENYFEQNVARKSEEAAKSLIFLDEQLPKVRLNLNQAEDQLNYYRQKNESVDLSLEAKSVLDSLVTIEAQINESIFREAEISKLYTQAHPAYRTLLEKRRTLEQEKERLNRRVSAMPKTQQEIIRLTRDVEAGRVIYMFLLNKQQELNISKASAIGNVRIIDNALAQPDAVKPKKTLIVLIAMVMGFLLSSLFVIVKTILHKGIENIEALEAEGVNVYAAIPLSEWQRKKDHVLLQKNRKKTKKSGSQAGELLALGNPADLAIEAIRSLRTSLHFAMLEAKNNVLMISGASPVIGKTFVSSNLAAVIAQAGQSVLLVDSDLRKGYAHKLMQTDEVNGLSDILSGQISVEKGIRKTVIDNMDFIPRGQIPPNPSELLMHARFNEFVSWASKNYDIVLLDTPPILAVTDAAIISKQAGTSLLVARFEVTTLKEVEVSIKRFEQNGTQIKGVILNAVVKKASNYQDYGAYGYYKYSDAD